MARRRRYRLDANDREFIRCCKEEIADGSHMVIAVGSPEKADAMAAAFTDEELDWIEFRVPVAPPEDRTSPDKGSNEEGA